MFIITPMFVFFNIVQTSIYLSIRHKFLDKNNLFYYYYMIRLFMGKS